VVRDLASLRDAPLYTFQERELDAYLGWLCRQPMTTPDRVVLLARKNIGQPYRVFLLGEYPFELYDPDPMVCLSASDCVTFVEHTYAMALSQDWPSFFRTLQRIRYKDGKIGMLTRNHFTEADWNVNNVWLFDDVTAAVAGEYSAPMRVRVDRAAFFSKHGLGRDLPVEIFEDVYLPCEHLAKVLHRFQNGDVVEIVRGETFARYVGHMGLLMRDADGVAIILHSGPPAVREESLSQYVERHPDMVGLKFLRMAASVSAE
jgi:hypothetical protein